MRRRLDWNGILRFVRCFSSVAKTWSVDFFWSMLGHVPIDRVVTVHVKNVMINEGGVAKMWFDDKYGSSSSSSLVHLRRLPGCLVHGSPNNTTQHIFLIISH
jgi:hypothetical protein